METSEITSHILDELGQYRRTRSQYGLTQPICNLPQCNNTSWWM